VGLNRFKIYEVEVLDAHLRTTEELRTAPPALRGARDNAIDTLDKLREARTSLRDRAIDYRTADHIHRLG
jgi:hypothetical protein